MNDNTYVSLVREILLKLTSTYNRQGNEKAISELQIHVHKIVIGHKYDQLSDSELQGLNARVLKLKTK